MLVFLHAHKSAGTTLRQVIESQHTARGAAVECYAWGWDPQEAARQVLRIAGAGQDSPEVVYGHVHYGLHRYLPGPTAYYTLLRDTMERALFICHNGLHISSTFERRPARPTRVAASARGRCWILVRD